MTDHIEELRKRGMITSLAKVPGAKTDSIEALREVLRRVAADTDGLLVLAKIARDEAGRLRELVTSMLAAAPEPGEGE